AHKVAATVTMQNAPLATADQIQRADLNCGQNRSRSRCMRAGVLEPIKLITSVSTNVTSDQATLYSPKADAPIRRATRMTKAKFATVETACAPTPNAMRRVQVLSRAASPNNESGRDRSGREVSGPGKRASAGAAARPAGTRSCDGVAIFASLSNVTTSTCF